MLILIRHGESQKNAGETSDLNSGLTKKGMDQAATVGDKMVSLDLAGFQGVVSPFLRTRQTAEIISSRLGMFFTACSALRDWSEDVCVEGKVYQHETKERVEHRVESIFRRRLRGRDFVVVSHQTPIAILMALSNLSKWSGDFSWVQHCFIYEAIERHFMP